MRLSLNPHSALKYLGFKTIRHLAKETKFPQVLTNNKDGITISNMNNPIHPYAIYDSKQVASLLGVDIVTVQRYVRNGKLPATKLGKVYRISGQSVLSLMDLNSDSVSTTQDRVRKVESSNYTLAKTYLLNNPKGKNYFNLFSSTADALHAMLEPNSDDSIDTLTIKYIGSRSFNSAMCAYRDILSGYYQVSLANQRDLIEIQFLMDLFRTEPAKIAEWKSADNKKRIEQFSAGEVRKILDKRDGFNEKKRAKRYMDFCEYGSHVSYSGFKLIANKNNLIEIGPFYDENKIINTLHELCFNFGYVTFSIGANLKVKNPKYAIQILQHMEEYDSIFGFNITKQENFIAAKANIHAMMNQLEELNNSEK